MCVAWAWSLPRTRRDSTPTEYELPSNASLLLSRSLQTGFVCDEKVYGFYADPENACQIFHVCYPYVDADLIVKLRMFSFICGPGLVFDQEKLVCDYPENAIPCEAAESFYSVNNYFGRIDLNFREAPTPTLPEETEFRLQTLGELRRDLEDAAAAEDEAAAPNDSPELDIIS
ncbi:U-scoloptoxin(01)-Cw1a-like isoform X2 [Eriocheir sinensis]|uniref:U-scoloptoxin(01)-Cw1a-like isoform X2 n=1 Tax=Eriocheir sinensis TaxID=95602 RepID=UPI0021C5E80C|nr:U-scoloptoxin(01)-Cw1a-like isoform X2 [Eriocheir sinensis]